MIVRQFIISTLKFVRVPHEERGAALIITLLFFFAISIATIIGASTAVNRELRSYTTLSYSKYSYYAAESGIEDAVYRLRKGKQLGSSIITTLNGATSTVTVNSVDDSHTIVTAVGNATSRIRELDLDITKSNIANFNYGAQVGEGGITMNNNATIDGTGLAKGDVFANGPISGANGTSITGDVTISAPLPADTSIVSTTCESDEVIGKTNPNIDYAESFVAPTSETLAKISLYIKRISTPSSQSIRIVADNGGVPDTSALATQSLSYSLASTNYGWVDIVFSNPSQLVAGQTYWILFDATQDGSKYWNWCRSNANTFGGTAMYKQSWTTGSPWTAITGDLDFKLILTSGTSTITNTSVSGTVKADTISSVTVGGDAYYQVLSGGSVGGTSYPGSATPAPIPFPIASSTIAQWKSDATGGGVTSGNYNLDSTSATIGPREITGNLTMTNSAVLTISGTVYVHGNIDISNNATLKCHTSYGASSCIVMADGYINVSNNAIFSGSGTSGSFVLLLTDTKNCYGSGSPGPCASNNSAIQIGNNAAGALFYASDGLVELSNNVVVTAVVGWGLSLTNGSSIIYDSKLSSLTFAPSATSSLGGWTVNKWKEQQL